MFTYIKYYSNWKVNQIMSCCTIYNTLNHIDFRFVDFKIHLIKLFSELYILSVKLYTILLTHTLKVSTLLSTTYICTIFIIFNEFVETIIINNYYFLILFLCVSTSQLNCIHTATICHE